MLITLSGSGKSLSQKIFPSLFSAIPRVTWRLNLHDMVFLKENLEELFSVCNAEELELTSCFMDVSSAPDLSSNYEYNILDTNSRIKELTLFYIKGNDSFYKLLGEGISKSQRLINSLEYVIIQDNEYNKKDVEDMKDVFEQAGLHKLELETRFY